MNCNCLLHEKLLCNFTNIVYSGHNGLRVYGDCWWGRMSNQHCQLQLETLLLLENMIITDLFMHYSYKTLMR